MHITNLNDLYINLLRDIYSAEKQLVQALPKVAKAVTSPDLQHLVSAHLKETEQQVQRLDRIFELLKEKPAGETCEAMQGLIQETDELIEHDMPDDVLDAGVIACAQKVEHYEIASYGTASSYAKLLGFEDHFKLLQESLAEEKGADKKLTECAEKSINALAAAA